MLKIFISHSSFDKEFAHKLSIDLKKRGIAVWYDSWEMKVGESLTQKIQAGIKESSFLAVILSPNSVNSNWVKVELQVALNKEITEGKVFVLPILYKPCTIPTFLRDKLYADFHTDYHHGLQQLLFTIGGSASKFKHSEEMIIDITNVLIVDKIEKMSPLELLELVKYIEERLGVSSEPPDVSREIKNDKNNRN
jgi:hypothetical protein